MSTTDLARMSTQIAQFFEPYPPDEAIEGVQDHLLKFWTPAMRANLAAVRRAGSPALHPLVVEAVDRLLVGSRA